MANRKSRSTSQPSDIQNEPEVNLTANEPITAPLDSTPSEQSKRLHLFGTVLTYASPSSNHRGKGDDTESPLQTITKQGRDLPVMSAYAIRSALRQMLIMEGQPSNRSRINDGGAPKVEFKDFPDPDRYADDFLFGFCVTDRAAVAAHPDQPSRRDSVFRNNMAVALSSDINTHLQQAPRNTENSPWNNIKETSLLYRQVIYTAYQYPFALTLSDCLPQPKWTAALIKAIGQLNRVAGGDSVSHFQMGPRSIIIRLTPSLVAGYDNYGFQEDGSFKELNRLVIRSGTYRDTMPIMPPSAAYGLILNLAGIEMRGSLQHSVTPIRPNLPPLKLAFGRVAGNASEISVLLQHMHNYPVGTSGKEHKTKTHGSKYGIEPTHRETIVDLDMMLGIIADPTLISRVKQGLSGEDNHPRYGLPFAGDNNYLFDRIDCLDEPIPSHWFVSVDSNLEQEPGAVSLTVEIDRHAPSKTKSMLFSATKDSLTSLPDLDWLSMYERRIIRR